MINALLAIDISIVNLIISIIAAILGVSALSLSIKVFVKIKNEKDSNRIEELEQTIKNGKDNKQAGRDING